MGAWSRTGLEATIIEVSSRVRKHSALNWSTTLQKVAGTVAPLRITRLATLNMCGVPPQVAPSNLRDLSVQAIVRFLARVS